VEPLPRLFPAQAQRCVVADNEKVRVFVSEVRAARAEELHKAEHELVVALQQIIESYEMDDYEVLEMLHRLVGVGISRVSGGCVAEDA
jgi:hypothetical protein